MEKPEDLKANLIKATSDDKNLPPGTFKGSFDTADKAIEDIFSENT